MLETMDRFSRRSLLKGSGVFVGCLALGGVREALARARQSGKPLLSDKAFNGFVRQQAENWLDYQRLASQAQQNLSAFLGRHFTLTAAQKSALSTVTSQHTAVIRQAVAYSMRKKGIVTIQLGQVAPKMRNGFDMKTGTGALTFETGEKWECHVRIDVEIK
jgi:hypothetical protein